MRVTRIIHVILLALPISCLATEYEDFKRAVQNGKESEVIREFLDTSKIRYKYYTCEEAKKIISSEPTECKNENSVGIYKGIANDGSYMLGIGSSDVSFQIEIDSNQKAVDIRTRYVYTFL